MSIRATGINQPSRNKAGYKDAADFFTKSSKTACQPGGIHISAALGAIGLLIDRRIAARARLLPSLRAAWSAGPQVAFLTTAYLASVRALA
jgi:hypothetical protein